MRKAKIESDLIAAPDATMLDVSLDTAPYLALLVGEAPAKLELIESVRRTGVALPIASLMDHRDAAFAIESLHAGVDDVIVKPFNAHELKARLHAIKRRLAGHVDGSRRLGRLTVYYDGRDPEVDGKRIKLSHREHTIFNHLALNIGRVVAKESVYTAVYGALGAAPFDKVIDVYICKLRKKLAEATGGDQYIETVYCRGYKLDAPENTTVQRLASFRRSAA